MTNREEFVTFMLNNYDKLNWCKLHENDRDETYVYTTCIPKISNPKYFIHVGSTRLSTYMTVRNPDDETQEINELQDVRVSRLFQLVADKIKTDDVETFFQNALKTISESIL